MDPDIILDSLYKYKREEGSTNFLSEMIQYFEDLDEEVYEIDNTYELAGVRLTLFYNKDKYKFIVSNRKNDSFVAYRKIRMNEKTARNLQKQINAIVENNDDLCKNWNERLFKTLYFGIVEGEETRSYFYEIDSLFLSGQMIYFLEKQNLDHYCQLQKEGKSQIVLDDFSLLREKIKDLDWRVKDRLFIYSGGVFQFLGVIYSEDIDLIYVSKDETYKEVDGLEEYFDLHVVTPKKVIEVKDEKEGKKTLHYKEILYRKTIAGYVGAENIYEMILDPQHYFNFIGVKCIDLFSSIYRNNARSNSFTMIDLVLLKEYVDIDMIDKFCIKNIVIRRGKITINNDQKMEAMYNKASKFMKIWYDRDVKPEYFEKRFKRCQNIYFLEGKNQVDPPPEIYSIFKHNRNVLRKVVKNYPTGNLLDIGIGKCSSLWEYTWRNYKKIVGIEPSLESLKLGKQKLIHPELQKIETVLYPGKGEEEWDPQVYKIKYDLIILNFTIHYMVNNIDKLVDNIDRVTKRGSVICINFLNGENIFNNLVKYKGQYKIMWKDDLQWGAFKFNQPIERNSEFLFYMNGAYGVMNGSLEKLVYPKELIKTFGKKFKVLQNKSFLDFLKPNTRYIKHKFQRDIISMNHILLLSKK